MCSNTHWTLKVCLVTMYSVQCPKKKRKKLNLLSFLSPFPSQRMRVFSWWQKLSLFTENEGCKLTLCKNVFQNERTTELPWGLNLLPWICQEYLKRFHSANPQENIHHKFLMHDIKMPVKTLPVINEASKNLFKVLSFWVCR